MRRKKCECISKKPNRNEIAPVVPIESRYPFEIASIDFLHLDRCKGGFEYILTGTDHFTCLTQVCATQNKLSKAAASKLFHNFVL